MAEVKYDEALYIDTGFYGLDEDVQNYEGKIVTCRKIHKCVSCASRIKIGEKALCERGFLDRLPVSAYTCINCLEEWMEESKQPCSF